MDDKDFGGSGSDPSTEKIGTRNVAHMGLAFFFLFFAFNTVQALQSSVNQSVGLIALGLLYLVFSATSLLGATPMSQKTGSKLAIAIGLSLSFFSFCHKREALLS